MGAVKVFGARLFEAVFEGEVRACLRSSLDEAARQDAGLRIRLHLRETPELANWPWEYVYNPALNRFFSLSVETPLVRYLDLPERIRPLAIRPPLRVLVMISSPSDYIPLDVEGEWAKLQEALSALEERGLVALERLEEATLAALQRKLRQGEYHILHFIGHGTFSESREDGVLVMEDELGRSRPVSGQDLGMLLHDHRSLRLAILNACEGARTSSSDPFAGTAQSLVQQGIPAVIGMQFPVTDPAAITLAHEFYGALADGYPVDASLAEARKALFAQGNAIEWGTPVLHMRSPDGVLFDVQGREEVLAQRTPLPVSEPKRAPKGPARRKRRKPLWLIWVALALLLLAGGGLGLGRVFGWPPGLGSLLGWLPEPTATPVAALSTPAPTAMTAATPTWTATPTSAVTPTPTPSPVPTATPTLPAGTAATPTAQPATHTPLPTNTVLPTSTVAPTVTETAGPVTTAEPTPVPSPSPVAAATSAPSIPAGMIWIPAGEFQMGSDPGHVQQAAEWCNCPPQRFEDELYLHEVQLDGYYIDSYEVTNLQFQAFVHASGYVTDAERKSEANTWRTEYTAGKDNHPVVWMTWNDAHAYCEWAGKRLPTEAEWEKAARGPTMRLFPWGDNWDGNRLNSSASGRGTTTPVGSSLAGASPFGVMDMAGNVWEWVNDWYDAFYYQTGHDQNPIGPEGGVDRVLRGGGYSSGQADVRTAKRHKGGQTGYAPDHGFRCAQ